MDKYPSVLYGPEKHDVRSVLSEADEAQAREEGYKDSPADWGYITAPSVDQMPLIDGDGKLRAVPEPKAADTAVDILTSGRRKG